MSLTSISEALTSILDDASTKPPGIEFVPLLASLGRVIAQAIVSDLDIPPWDNSAMDGYALNTEDFAAERVFPVSQKVFAGQAGDPLEAGTAARIFTGAPVPMGADAVVMQENTRLGDDEQLVITAAPKIGQHIRRCGEDINAGDALYDVGASIGVSDLAVLASIGIAEVPVFKRLKVAVFSSGDELVEPGTPLRPGQIYNANRVLLSALLGQHSCDVLDAGVVPDSLHETEQVLQRLASSVDLMVSTGGVSVGEADFLKAALAKVGRIHLWKLAIKPGKPLVYGRVGATPYFGLPGNPSSAFVTFQVIVKPYLDALLGIGSDTESTYAKTDFAWPNAGSRQEYLRVQMYSDGYERRLRLYPNQSSGAVSSFAWANALAIVPVGAMFEKDCVLEVLPITG